MSQFVSQRYNVEPPYIYSGSDDVYKLTIFMTPAHDMVSKFETK